MQRLHLAAIMTLACLSGVAVAQQQQPVGQGNALDGGLSTYDGPFNEATSISNYRGRNNLVTGNVIGGRGFRGTVGYTAEFDFRAETGSDDLFDARANMAISSPHLIAQGGSMQQLRFGQNLNEVTYRKASRGGTTANLSYESFSGQSFMNTRLALDKIAISSRTSAIYEGSADARVIGMMRSPEGEMVTASASSLMGLQMTPATQQVQLIGLTSLDLARTVDDLVEGRMVRRLGEEFPTSFTNLLAEAPAETPIEGRLETTTDTPKIEGKWIEQSYREIMESIAERHARHADAEPGSESTLLSLDQQFQALRDQLAEQEAADAAAAEADEAGADGQAGDAGPGGIDPTMPTTTPTVPGLPDPPTTEMPTLEVPESLLEVEAIAMPLRHDQRVDAFANPEDESRFNELMAYAEEALRDGEYFWAERRFERAERFAPGHPFAAAGMGHAQLGAGLYVPAALSLRRLLTQNPEMIDVQYGPNVLPSEVRLNLAVPRLRELIATVQRDRELHAFLLAYLGHQLEDKPLIREGLDGMAEDDPLKRLLTVVWLDPTRP